MKYIVAILMLVLGMGAASAQEVYTSSGRPDHGVKKKKVEGFDPSRLIIGGGLIAGFGSGYANFGASPIVGYKITERWSAGVGLGYQYVKMPEYLYDQSIGDYKEYAGNYNLIYPSVWSRFFVFRNIYAIGDFEYNITNYKGHDYDPYTSDIISVKKTVNVPCLLLGAGVRQPIGGRVGFFAEILFDVLNQPYSPYAGQPDIRLGICAGL